MQEDEIEEVVLLIRRIENLLRPKQNIDHRSFDEYLMNIAMHMILNHTQDGYQEVTGIYPEEEVVQEVIKMEDTQKNEYLEN